MGKRKTGRPLLLADDGVVKRLLDCIKLGVDTDDACNYAGITTRSYYSWKAEAKEIEKRISNGATPTARDKVFLHFLQALKKADADFIRSNHKIIEDAAKKSWQAAAWLLERRRPEKYSLTLRGIDEETHTDLFAEAASSIVAMEGTMRGIAPPAGFLPETWTTFNWTPAQLRVLTSRARFIGLPCGRGSGKTEIALRRLVIALAQKRPWNNPLYFYAAPTNPQAIRIAWDRIGALMPHHWVRKIQRSEQFIETIFGSRLYILGMDVPARIEGPQWDFGVVDESCDQQPGAFDKSIRPALSHRNGSCWRLGVPKRYGIGASEFRKWCEEGAEGRFDDRETIAWPSSDVLPAEEVESARRTLDPRDFDEQFNANWITAGGGMFWAFDETENVRPGIYDPSATLLIGCDFNVDPMCWVFGQKTPAGAIIHDELTIANANTQLALDRTWSRYAKHKGRFEFYCDASGGSRKTAAQSTASGEIMTDLYAILNDRRFKESPGGRTLMFPTMREDGKFHGNPPFRTRIAECNAMFLNAAGERRLFVAPGCTTLINDLRMRSDDSTDPDIGHASDALGYIVHRLWPIRVDVVEHVPQVIITGGR